MKINVAVAQIKPKKGDYAYNLNRVGDLFAQLEADTPAPDVLVLPETVLSGYFLEGGVREIARTREELFADLLRTYRERVTRPDAILDICLGFYELGEGKYFNSALYATLTGEEEEREAREQGTGNSRTTVGNRQSTIGNVPIPCRYPLTFTANSFCPPTAYSMKSGLCRGGERCGRFPVGSEPWPY